jgi:hypothetical protein
MFTLPALVAAQRAIHAVSEAIAKSAFDRPRVAS